MQAQRTCRFVPMPMVLLTVCGTLFRCALASAQIGGIGISSQYDLSGSIQIEEAGRTVETLLDRVDAYLVDGKWNEAVDTIRQVMETSGDKLLQVAPRRYVNARMACQLRIAGLPAEALHRYRSLVDPVAGRWYEAWQHSGERAWLEKIVSDAFASSWGDDALLALGEIAFEAGQYAVARACWLRILPFQPPAGQEQTWLAFPDSQLDLASVRARLVLLTILEGDTEGATMELAEFARMHPGAAGHLGGKTGDLVETLRTILRESQDWPGLPAAEDWLTFGGSPKRHRDALRPVAGPVAWEEPLWPPASSAPNPRFLGPLRPAVAEDAAAPLSYHPVALGGLVFVSNRSEILALDARSGKPAWGAGGAAIFRDRLEGGDEQPPLATAIGTARHTLTVADGRLYARMGSQVTSHPQGPGSAGGGGYLVCLDLRSQGRLLWKTEAEDQWAFEGVPLVRGDDVFVALRRNDIRPQAHVACFDARTGLLRWRRFLCAAETPSRAILPEITSGLLTLDGDSLYYATNLGAVAALAAVMGSGGDARMAALVANLAAAVTVRKLHTTGTATLAFELDGNSDRGHITTLESIKVAWSVLTVDLGTLDGFSPTADQVFQLVTVTGAGNSLPSLANVTLAGWDSVLGNTDKLYNGSWQLRTSSDGKSLEAVAVPLLRACGGSGRLQRAGHE